ncbi:uncharacterized protein LOC109947149 [Prunus persica]|uniref:uncharacterized protein LOC109947149 n=1 Tax=Prunus persica TaxID=3760 RepID=UPI0009AB6F18|nr:uncharacterized protein LOC109947149 [Prunus persica]
MGDNSIISAVAAASANLCVYDSIPGTGFNTWIIDTGASDHMTYDAKFFDELSSNTCDPYISSANGLPSPITGEGTISLTPTLSLSCALLVPNIHCNLLFVGRLLDTLNVSATFYSTHCFFQDLKTHKTIGHVSKTSRKFGYGIVAWDTRNLATLSGEKRSELESFILENDVFEDTALGKEMTYHTKASDRSPISEYETCGLYEETTDHPLELDRSPISGDEAGALGVETTDHPLELDRPPISGDEAEFGAIPPYALLVPQSTRDTELSELSSVYVPTKLQDALSNPKWMDARNVEMDSLNKNKTWNLIPLPQGKKAVGCRWVFTLKHKADGSIDHYKARLVAKGYTQTYGVDDLETFAPVAKLNTEEIYMDLPHSIHVTSKEGVACKVRKSLYGLKQSLKAWFRRFAASMKKFGYVQNQAEMQNLQKYLASEFGMKSLGDLKYFLGIEVVRSKHMSQFMHSPSEDHMSAVMRILRYLKVTPEKGLMFCKYGHTDVEGYTDTDWAGSIH